MLVGLRVVLIQPLPAIEMLQPGRDRAVTGIMTIGDDDQRIPVEKMGDSVKVIPVVVLIGVLYRNVLALHLDEDQG